MLTYLKPGGRTLDLTVPRVMGVLNVTPDSFSNGGGYPTTEAALRAALSMVAAGASIIDIGGESTRPGARDVPGQQQLDRVMPVLAALRRESDVIVSIDTGNAGVIRETTAAGADMINDVFALRQPGAMAAAAASGAGVCVMHMRGTPSTMQDTPAYDDLLGEVQGFLAERVAACRAAGIAGDRIVVDPGFGFGKSDEHNLVLLARLQGLLELGQPLLVGLSRKGTLGRLTGRPVTDRLAAGVAAAVIAVERGAHIVRTHDVAATVDAIKIAQAVKQAGSR